MNKKITISAIIAAAIIGLVGGYTIVNSQVTDSITEEHNYIMDEIDEFNDEMKEAFSEDNTSNSVNSTSNSINSQITNNQVIAYPHATESICEGMWCFPINNSSYEHGIIMDKLDGLSYDVIHCLLNPYCDQN